MKANWQTKKLAEVCDIGAGNSAPQNKDFFVNGKYPFFRTSDVGNIHIGKIINSNDYLNEKGIKGLKLYKKGTILLPKSGASTFLNHRVILDVDGYVSSHLATIKTTEKLLESDFLFYYLLEIKAQDLIQDHKYPSLNLQVIGDIQIPLPPLPTQHRIVKILDEIFSDIAKAKEHAEKNLQNTKELFESYLQNIFANPASAKATAGKPGEDWEEKTLKELTLKIGSGATPRGGRKSYKNEGISLIRSMNVHDRRFKEKNLALIDDTQASNLSNVTLEEGDVLLNITGASVTRCCVMPIQYLPARVNQHVSIIRPRQELIDTYFLNYLLTTKLYKDQLFGIGEQGATRQAITKAQIENFTIIFPKSIAEQKSIVIKLDALFAETKKLEAIYQQKLANLEELKKSVLKKAFAGELVE
ncbi:MAG: restriction endonuclease subunit S [Candidatus Magasanikbacteria bacterium CG_4_10_14_0_2_um_filter_41_31]|uniref:Restriction endonuclease subunit S n=1 Tax=Candidatus Magasanikbacteria bacterium CG_4_10_14_0_2_um_filter_41_31 TaxID=1974639 RepID=A0A2M7V1N4_9BACT|nr:MAG: restriction endonuclease subunit S [Candidatus Magasanikbacteria bacterium CG_4_10_14_0_2_um_filter_41_31]